MKNSLHWEIGVKFCRSHRFRDQLALLDRRSQHRRGVGGSNVGRSKGLFQLEPKDLAGPGKAGLDTAGSICRHDMCWVTASTSVLARISVTPTYTPTPIGRATKPQTNGPPPLVRGDGAAGGKETARRFHRTYATAQ